jgi:hypothetical protein
MSVYQRQLDVMALRRRDRCLVTGIRVARHANPRIVGQYPLDARAHFRAAVGNQYLPRVQRIADTDAATVME